VTSETTSANRAAGPPGSARFRIGAWLGARSEVISRSAFIWPALLVLLFISIFPLFYSVYMSFSDVELVRGGFDIHWVGLDNFRELFSGTLKSEFLGVSRSPTPIGWLVIVAGLAAMAWGLARAARGGVGIPGLIFRTLAALFVALLLWLVGHTLFGQGGRPGTVVVTIVFVVAGVLLQFAFGLGLAYLVTLGLPGQRFFRVVLLLPMTITPVGVAYMFRMMMDTDKGPLEPIFAALGLENWSWANSAWGARAAVIIGDTWQWTPFMFIVLLAALEGQDLEPIEAATVDGANRWQILRYITMPAIFPVALTIILLRLIEAFKIIDLPNVLTSGGPGTATESLTLQSYFHWRSLDLGISAATANSLMVLVTIIAVIYVTLLRRRVAEE
jgi:multiple sugar transport system permease protein